MDQGNQSAVRRNVVGADDDSLNGYGIEIIASDIVVTDNLVKRGASIVLSVSNKPKKNNVFWGYNTIRASAQLRAQSALGSGVYLLIVLVDEAHDSAGGLRLEDLRSQLRIVGDPRDAGKRSNVLLELALGDNEQNDQVGGFSIEAVEGYTGLRGPERPDNTVDTPYRAVRYGQTVLHSRTEGPLADKQGIDDFSPVAQSELMGRDEDVYELLDGLAFIYSFQVDFYHVVAEKLGEQHAGLLSFTSLSGARQCGFNSHEQHVSV